MHLIDSLTALAGKFVKGNPTTGQKATQFTDAWCNAIQEEIANAVSMEGRALSKGDNAQLKKTLEGKFFSYTSRAVVANAGEISFNNPGVLSAAAGLVLTAAQKYEIFISFNAKPNFADARLGLVVSGTGIFNQNINVDLGVSNDNKHIMLHTVFEYDKTKGSTFTPSIKFEVLNGTAIIDKVSITNVAVDLIAHNHA